MPETRPGRLFGKSTHPRYSLRDAATIGRFLRTEPLWPLLHAIWTLRRMSEAEFARATRVLRNEDRPA